MTCPRCKLECTPNSETCDCGYIFALRLDQQPAQRYDATSGGIRRDLAVLGIVVLGLDIAATLWFFLTLTPVKGLSGGFAQGFLVVYVLAGAIIAFVIGLGLLVVGFWRHSVR